MTMSNNTLLQLVKKQVEKQGEKPALIEAEGRKISYRGLDDYAGRIAEKMRQSNVRKNDTVALVLPSGSTSSAENCTWSWAASCLTTTMPAGCFPDSSRTARCRCC